MSTTPDSRLSESVGGVMVAAPSFIYRDPNTLHVEVSLQYRSFDSLLYDFYIFCHFLQGPNSILVAMVMLLNIGLAIIFVHFLT